MLKDRRKFLRKALGVGAIASAAMAGSAASYNAGKEPVAQGKSKKQEVLYYKSKMWEQYYKIAY